MELRGARVAVTGATGFLGRYLVDALLDAGAVPIGVVRNPDRVPSLRARGVELRRADLADRAALAAGFAGADAVVSNAALLPLGNGPAALEQANVVGTRNVYDAIADAGVRRAIHVSSVSVYGMFAVGAIDETRPLVAEDARPWPWNAYGVSKARSERLAWAAAAAHGVGLTALRPCLIYGAFDDGFTRIFRRVVARPITVMPVWTSLGFVYAGDVAAAAVAALARDASVGRAYDLAGPPGSIWNFARAWRAAGGGGARWLVPLPVPWVVSFDARRAREELGWRPRSLEAGLRDTFAREAAAA
jgi:dihydroflavonol-4-reductase